MKDTKEGLRQESAKAYIDFLDPVFFYYEQNTREQPRVAPEKLRAGTGIALHPARGPAGGDAEQRTDYRNGGSETWPMETWIPERSL